MFAGPELMFDEVVPGSAHLLGLSQTPGVERQEDLESSLWLTLGSDCDGGANLAQNVFNMELKQPGHHISLLPSCVISPLLHILISSRPFHHLGLLSRLSAGVAEV